MSFREALDAKHEAEKALAEHMSKSEIDRLKQVQANMEEESLKTSERAKISEQNAKDQATKDDAQRKKEAEQQEAAAEKAADEAAAKNEMQMKHSEEMMKAEQLKNQQKDEANTKLMESMKSGNKAAQKAAMEKLALAAKGEEDTKEAAKQQVKLSQQATERAIKAQEAAREREKEMEERKKNLEKDLKHEHEKTTEVKIELAKAEAKAEYSEKAKQDFMKHAKVEDPERAHGLEVKVGRLEGTIAGMKDPCGGKGSDCGKCSGGDCGSEPVAHNDEDAIQTAVDAAVERLINKTRERKTEDDAIENIEEKSHEKEEVLKAERDTIVNEKMEVEKQKEEAEVKAKDNDADLALMKAEHQKTKLENGKLKSDMLNLQQTLTKMGEEKMELNNRLSDLSVPGRL